MAPRWLCERQISRSLLGVMVEAKMHGKLVGDLVTFGEEPSTYRRDMPPQ